MNRVTLAEVCDITMGQAPAGNTYNDAGDGIPLIAGAGDFPNGVLRPKKFTTGPTRLSRVGDVVLGIRATIGTKAWADGTYCLGRGVAGLRPRPALDRNYLWHWLSSAKPDLERQGRGATFLQVNRADIGKLELPLPPVEEQRRIAALLDQSDELRAKRQASHDEPDQLAWADRRPSHTDAFDVETQAQRLRLRPTPLGPLLP